MVRRARDACKRSPLRSTSPHFAARWTQNKQERAQIEAGVALLGAKARGAGIHLVLATQQPSRATISGNIQTNLPCRVALALGSPIESNMILGTSGAERLTEQER